MEESLVFGAIRREPEPEPEPESESNSGSNWDWELKPLEDLTLSDFSSLEDDISPFLFSCPRFEYKNKAQREKEAASKRALDEYLESSRNLTVRVSLSLSLLCY